MKEENIVFESEHFYVYRVKPCVFEVRKENGTHSYSIGTKDTLEGAQEFIQKAEKYPDNF